MISKWLLPSTKDSLGGSASQRRRTTNGAIAYHHMLYSDTEVMMENRWVLSIRVGLLVFHLALFTLYKKECYFAILNCHPQVPQLACGHVRGLFKSA